MRQWIVYALVGLAACKVPDKFFSGDAIGGVTSTTVDHIYTSPTLIPIQLTFSDPATVTGTPTLSLNSGGVASYSSGSGTNTLTFDYVVAVGDASNDLDYTGPDALALAGGTLKDSVGNDVTLVLPPPGTAGSLGGNKAIVIDAVPPVVSAITGPPAYTSSTSAALSYTVTEVNPGSTSCTQTVGTGILVSCTTTGATFTGLNEGAHTVSVTHTDLATNVSTERTYSWTIDPLTVVVEVLVIGGGGQGGGGVGYGAPSGGGAGGYQYDPSHTVTAQAYSIVVGNGGSAGLQNGSDSVFDNITAYGGGSGCTYNQMSRNGGSGGGSCISTYLPGTGSQGGNGGHASAGAPYGGGGGGGASANGGDGPNGGVGGDGISNSISGAAVTYAGGGGCGGTAQGASGQVGGMGGGGAGSSTGDGTSGTDGLGGGGGASLNNTPGVGGKGVVIISYVTADYSATATITGGTITTSGSRTVHTFTENGTLTITAR